MAMVFLMVKMLIMYAKWMVQDLEMDRVWGEARDQEQEPVQVQVLEQDLENAMKQAQKVRGDKAENNR